MILVTKSIHLYNASIINKETLWKIKNVTNYAHYVTNHAKKISVLKNTCIVKIK